MVPFEHEMVGGLARQTELDQARICQSRENDLVEDRCWQLEQIAVFHVCGALTLTLEPCFRTSLLASPSELGFEAVAELTF